MKTSAQTAISRKDPSLPARMLVDKFPILLHPYFRVLDYGCGKGRDADTYGWDRYDPNHAPEMPQGSYDMILCTYVLNTIPEEEVENLIEQLFGKLRPLGVAYLTVRRDRQPDQYTGCQRHVELDLPILIRKKGCFVTYVLDRVRQMGHEGPWQV